MTKLKAGDDGELEEGSNLYCPECGESLGYYAELIGHTIECDNCGITLDIYTSQTIYYEVTKESKQ